jgi:hypothetical protein
MKSNYKITLTAAATLIALGSFASVHAGTVTWDNNGGAGDNEWGTATNWDGDAVPGNDDTVIINNGDTVNITGNALSSNGANLDISVSGSALTFTGVGGAYQFNMAGATISLDGTSSFNGGGQYVRLFGSGFVIEDRARISNIATLEINGAGGSFTFGLEGSDPFNTIGLNNLGFNGGVTNAIDNTAFVVDFDGYTGGAQTFDLIDWNDGSATGLTEAIFNTANFSFLNGTGYEASTFNWNDTTNTVSLTVAVPEPSSAAALLGLVAVFAMVQRRKRS